MQASTGVLLFRAALVTIICNDGGCDRKAVIRPVATNEVLKRRLEEERDRLKREIEELASQASVMVGLASEHDAYGNHLADEASSDTFEHEKLLALENHLRGLLSNVEDALLKFDTGAYGKCERCGREINAERLEALPYASLCIDCKSKQEKERRRR